MLELGVTSMLNEEAGFDDRRKTEDSESALEKSNIGFLFVFFTFLVVSLISSEK